MQYLKVSIGIFFALATSRLIPHPPNFTSLIALSFYIPALFGIRYIPILVAAFIFSDLIIGFHSTTLFTWGSIIVIGSISEKFVKSFYKRLFGVLTSAFIFFIITNFGVWSLGTYGYNMQGFLKCYTLAIPFFTNTIISTILYSMIIEAIIKIFTYKKLFRNIY
ncbi:hypothetical protein OAO09_02290 [Candidatus Pelagibacter sp.]|nr:hypothetical protein [Candidatus Pelagibacter sp.]